MYPAAPIRQPPASSLPPQPAPEVRQSVANLLTQSEAFRRMSPADQQDIARNTALIADYLARPEGIEGNRIPGGLGTPAQSLADKSASEASWGERRDAVDAIGDAGFKANAAREGAKVAGELLNQVKFPTFVSGLIQGVFQSITDSSIQQMEAYQKMVAAVATSLKQFMDDNVSENQGRDHMVEQFPDLFEIGFDDMSDEPGPRLQLREGVDESEALKKVNNKLEFADGQIKSLDLSDANAERAIIEQARMQLARQRQQLMASIVLMGINRIVVTDGKISAKIIYDVKAQDSYAMRRSASAVDLARDKYGNVQTTYAGEGKYDSGADVTSSRSKDSRDYDASYYAKGEYKYENKPIITAQTAASEASNAAMQTKIQLSGAVDVNFKSDYLPLEKMATPQMIAAIQGNATPADPNVVPSARTAPSAPAAAPATTPAPAPAA
ncbi:hypothetical protein [Allosphingosinicella deserti]|uniref:Uncharacterized protein n=1 Tax=Allosphingosinicella deserti TaxID=2116704 RepID=A0A2P7QS87_9SPHN|nr:hypothetical protein [Sphingomonas deserti]PSJ40838.1 hypothetical protein C7I55_11170 [Sphingomonas deserti]